MRTSGIGRANSTSPDIKITMMIIATGPPTAFFGSNALRMPAVRPTISAGGNIGIGD